MAEATQPDLVAIINSFLTAQPRQLPTYTPPSQDSFNAALERVRQASTGFETAARTANENMRRSTTEMLAGYETQAAADATLLQENLARAQRQAQMAVDVARPFGGTADLPDSRLAQLAVEATQLRDQGRQMKRDITQRASTSLLSDPLTWLENQFTLPGMVQQQNAIISEAAAKENEFAQIVSNKSAALAYAARTIPSLTAAEVAAQTNKSAAEARIKAAAATRELAQADSQFASQLFAKELSVANLDRAQLDNAQQEALRVYQTGVEAIRFAASEDAQRLQAANLLSTMDSRLGKDTTNDQLAKALTRQFSLPEGAITGQWIASLPPARRQDVGIVASGGFQNPVQAIRNLQDLELNFGDNETGRAKARVYRTLSEMMTETARGRMVQLSGKKPTLADEININEEITQRINQQFNNPEGTAATNNLAVLPPPRVFFELDRNGTAGPTRPFIIGAQALGLSSEDVMRLARYTAPLLKASGPVPAATVATTIYEQAIADRLSPPQAAAAVASYFRVGVGARNATSNFNFFGLNLDVSNPASVANTYRIRRDRPGMFSGTATIDLTKPEDVQGMMILERQGRAVREAFTPMFTGQVPPPLGIVSPQP